MIEPDRAGMAHRRPQHLAIGLERLQFEPGGVETGEAPVLAGGVERDPAARRPRDGARSPIARSRHRTRRIARRRRRQGKARPSCRAGPRAPCRPATAGRPPIARIRRIRFRRHPGPGAGTRIWPRPAGAIASGHSHHGLPNLCRSTSKQANRDSSGARSAQNVSKSCLRSPLGSALKASKAKRSARHFSSATAA